MPKKKHKDRELTPEEVEAQRAEQLPDREAMSIISVPLDPPMPDDAGDLIPPPDPSNV